MSLELIIPVYLNQRIVFDMIAMLQGGIATVTRICSAELESGREEAVITIPFTFELGEPGVPHMSLDGENFVVPVRKTISDVWIVENFDADIR